MIDETKHGALTHGSYERQDLRPSGILYFLLALAVATVLCLVGLTGLFAYLERREKIGQPDVNPLITDVPTDTRHVAPGYPQRAFPNPKLEEDERGQLDEIRRDEQRALYTYGWNDEKTGTVHIPIERAMELLVQRGLPVRAQGAIGNAARQASDSKNGSAGRNAANPARAKKDAAK